MKSIKRQKGYYSFGNIDIAVGIVIVVTIVATLELLIYVVWQAICFAVAWLRD